MAAADSARKLAAAIQGAVDGFVNALDDYELAEEAKLAAREAGEISRAATSEAQAQAHTPEMQQLGGYMKTAGHKTADAAHAAADSVRSAAGTVRTGAGDLRTSTGERIDSAKESVQETVENVRYAARRAKEEATVRAEAVAETGRRARRAPGRIRTELGAAVGAWADGVKKSIAMGLMLIIFATNALIVLTIALVVGLNELIGDPAGTFVVALLYLVIAGIAFAVARSAKARAAERTQQHVENSKEEVRHVTRPVREAFSRGRTGI